MKREIRLENILNEIKRNIIPIIIVSVILALLVCAYSFVKVKRDSAGIQYGTKLVLLMEHQTEEKFVSGEKDLGDENESIIKSDSIINAIRSENQDRFANENDIDIRNKIFVQGRTNGDTMIVYAITDNQEESNAICNSIEENIVKYDQVKDIDISVIQKSSEMGPSRVELRDDYSDPEKQKTIVTTSTIPSFGAKSAVKKLMEGFISGLVCSVAWVFAAYVLKGTVRYNNELRSIGIEPYGTISEKNGCGKEVVLDAVGKLLTGYEGRSITIVPYGCKEISEEIAKAVKKEADGISVNCSEDIIADPVARKDIEKHTDLILAFKAGAVKIEEAFEEKQRFVNAGMKVKGALIVE